ncbi:hypothetical protein ACIA5D_29815 [Actinoplanes sp. NPDC051513]|uniref:hypothetical protein n=1 Tax=Actinoplanes sp. NPDC051513 TaxID=3363908 RepID=UPI00378F7FFF
MTETGWPLIPRDMLPAPVPKAPGFSAPSAGSTAGDATAAKRRPLSDLGRQLPFFGAETTEPSPADLAGLLAGPGRLDRMGGTARVSVEVDAAWRVHVLVSELVARGLTAHWRPLHDQDQDQDQDADVRAEEHHEPRGGRSPAPPGNRAVENHHAPESDPFDDVYPEPDAYPEPDPWPESSAADEPVDDDLLEDGRRDPQHPDAGRRVPVPGELSLTSGRRPAASEEESEKSDELGRSTSPAEPDPREELHKEADADETDEYGTDHPAPEPKPRFEVLTAYSSRLNGLARGWPEAATQLFLSGPRLRLWVAAAGEPVPSGYSLGLDPVKDMVAVDAALVRVGLAGRLSDDGRRYVIAGKRRLRRLAELVGERPDAAPEHVWPDRAGA